MRLRDRRQRRKRPLRQASSGSHRTPEEGSRARRREGPRLSPRPPPGQHPQEGGRPPGRGKSRAHVKDISCSFIRLLFKCIQFKVEK